MSIPKHTEMFVPALELLAKHDSLKSNEFEAPLAEHFDLNENELSQEYDSGNGKIFSDRVSWALSYIKMAGLVQQPRRATYQISEIGKQKIKTPEKIIPFVKEQKKEKIKATSSITTVNADHTPKEELSDSFSKIQLSVYNEIIDVVLEKSPREFEKLVVTLLQKMGYGGEVKSAGEVTQYSNDKGIDGIIKEDVLGLGRIHIQAKRYAREKTVGREEVQKFVGALAVAQSNKGVFITTSSYSSGANEYAKNLMAPLHLY